MQEGAETLALAHGRRKSHTTSGTAQSPRDLAGGRVGRGVFREALGLDAASGTGVGGTCEAGGHLLGALRQPQALLQWAVRVPVLPAFEVAGHGHLNLLGAHPFHDLRGNHRDSLTSRAGRGHVASLLADLRALRPTSPSLPLYVLSR